MARGFTPIIGLAVVVALALAAVFGSMSLANPAMAQTTGNNPPMVSDIEVDGGATSVVLRFTGNTDIAVGEWQVQYREQAANILFSDWLDETASNVTVAVDATSFVTTITVSELTPLRVYEFKVRAVDTDDGAGGESGVVLGVALTPPAGSLTLTAAPGQGEATLTVGGATGNVTGWQYRYRTTCISFTVPQDTDCTDEAAPTPADDQPQDDVESGAWSGWTMLGGVTGTSGDGKVSGLTAGTSYDFEARAINHRAIGTNVFVAPHGTAAATNSAEDPTGGVTPSVVPPPPPEPVNPSFEAGSTSSGSNTNYVVEFQIGDMTINTLSDELVIEFHEDYSLPSSISNSAVTIDVEGAVASEAAGSKERSDLTFNPSDIVVDGEKAIFSIGDMNEDDDETQYEIGPMAVITVKFRQAAGIRNPTEAGDYNIVEIEFGDFKLEYDDKNNDHDALNLVDGVKRKISLSEEDGGLGDMVTATAKGFENGVTLHFFLDKFNDKNGNGELDSGETGPDGQLQGDEDILCSVPSVSGSNVASCDFEVTTPTFSTGENYVSAVDGDGNSAFLNYDDDHRFVLTASISASPAGGSPGEIMQVQMVSFPAGMGIQEIKLSGDYICGGTPPGHTQSVNCSSFGNVGSMGTASIAVTVPNWAIAGVQELRIMAGGETDTTNVTIVGPRIISTPATVVANQRVSLVGTGFSPNSVLGDDTEQGRAISKISIGGHPIPWAKVNDGRDVNVDDGGNWSASVDLPLVDATTGSGERALRVTDSMARGGVVMVALAERSFDITPAEGRVGTLAVVRGVGYPSKNDEGHSFTIDVIYKVQEGATSRVSVVPDASGRFEVQLRIPTTASIPSTNQVEVSFDHEMGGTGVLENKQHFVPEGIIELSETSGGPGTVISLHGEGFKTFVPVESVKVGTIEVTPSPKPNTDSNGMMDFDILIPGLDVGIQTIEVKVGGTTSSTGFTVTESGVAPGDIMPVAEAFEELGDNLVSVWNFNNDTKVWSFYDPTLEEGNTLTHTITGEPYFIRIKSNVEVILNRDTRSLTCVGDNCWNPIVW